MDTFIIIVSAVLPLSYFFILGAGSAYYKGSTLEAFSVISVFCPNKFEGPGKKYYKALLAWYCLMGLSIGFIFLAS